MSYHYPHMIPLLAAALRHQRAPINRDELVNPDGKYRQAERQTPLLTWAKKAG